MDQNFIDLLMSNIDELRRDIGRLDAKINLIMNYRNQIWGGAVVLSFIVTVLIQVGLRFIN